MFILVLCSCALAGSLVSRRLRLLSGSCLIDVTKSQLLLIKSPLFKNRETTSTIPRERQQRVPENTEASIALYLIVQQVHQNCDWLGKRNI
jgi:hypothetical protein